MKNKMNQVTFNYLDYTLGNLLRVKSFLLVTRIKAVFFQDGSILASLTYFYDSSFSWSI